MEDIEAHKAEHYAFYVRQTQAVVLMPLADIVKEAQRILEAAEQNNIVLRLLGGLAVRFHCPSATHRALGRDYADIDFMGLRKQSRDTKALFTSLGYVPRGVFNQLQGARRLIFNDIENQRRIDIFLDVFEMCHRFNFKDRLVLDKATITLADLLATKLQVVEITDREYRDMMALLHDHTVGDSDAPETINAVYLASLCADDWGIYKTFTANISNILSAISKYQLDPAYDNIIRKNAQELQSRIESVPKTLRWRMRAKVGERKQWYTLPEQDKEIVDSRVG